MISSVADLIRLGSRRIASSWAGSASSLCSPLAIAPRVVSLPANTTADELATALNALGVEPRDLISIFQALKEAGSLPAKMEIL